MFIHTKKKIVLLITSITLLTGCGGGSASNTPTTSTTNTPTTSTSTGSTTSISDTPTTSNTPTSSTVSHDAIQEGQVKDLKTGKGLPGVKVSLGNSTTTTDANGFYSFSSLTPTKEVVVNFEKEGYLLGSSSIELRSKSEKNTVSSNYLEYNMYINDYNYKTEENIDSSRIFVDIGNLIDIKGDAYNSSLSVSLTILDSSEEAFLKSFPGSFKGINSNNEIVQFTSYGLININIKEDKGNRLYLSDTSVATLVFHVPSSEKDQTLPLWFYDYKKESWVEEGYAQLQDDGTYKGEISHLGTWSMSKPVEDAPAVYTDRILYPDGTPVKNLRIYAVGKNWISADLSTDENGVFEIKVVPEEEFGLQVYHYNDKYAAKFNGIIPALIAGETVNKIQ